MSNRELIKRLREYGDEPQDVSMGEWAEWSHKAASALEAHEWRTDMENAPLAEPLYAGLWVRNNVTESKWFERYIVDVGDDGNYVCAESRDPLPWSRSDFTHWKPLDTPPPNTGQDT